MRNTFTQACGAQTQCSVHHPLTMASQASQNRLRAGQAWAKHESQARAGRYQLSSHSASLHSTQDRRGRTGGSHRPSTLWSSDCVLANTFRQAESSVQTTAITFAGYLAWLGMATSPEPRLLPRFLEQERRVYPGHNR